jgi:hypothetical protein
VRHAHDVPVTRAVALAAVALACAAGTARAADGVLEINQACALTGCFAGDAPGFPVTTASNASYVLTSSLTLPTENSQGVTLGSRSTLDFNGFSLIGAITCTGIPPTCQPFGNSTGVLGGEKSVIQNGTIRGVTYAIRSGNGTRVERMNLEGNSNDGIRADMGAANWIIEGCLIAGNGGIGISLNYGDGSDGALVRGNVVRGNVSEGMVVTRGLVVENSIVDNGDYGLTGGAAYGSNYLSGNKAGGNTAQVGTGTQIGQNVCGFDTTCP